LKTLIILDTNKIRSMNLGGASYGSFEFGSEFDSLSSYVREKGLSEFIEIAVPNVALEELLQQKAEQYSEDIETIAGISNRLSELPGVDLSQVSLPAKSFDPKEHLEPRMRDFVKRSELTVIDLEEEKLGPILKEVLKRAIERRPPFRRGAKSKDMGFKDVMIWESILHFDGCRKSDKVMLLTTDSDFNEKCKQEFESKVKREILITPSVDFVLATIDADYAFVIQNKKWIDFVKADYFKSYFDGKLSKLEYLTVSGVERKVVHVSLVNPLDAVEELESEEGSEAATVLVASLKATVDIDGHATDVNVRARTYVDDAMGIDDTDFDVTEP